MRAIARALRGKTPKGEYNIEGDPRPELLDLVEEVRPDQCTLVPVAPVQAGDPVAPVAPAGPWGPGWPLPVHAHATPGESAKALPGAIYGILLIGLMYVMPSGVAGALKNAPRLFSRAKHG